VLDQYDHDSFQLTMVSIFYHYFLFWRKD